MTVLRQFFFSHPELFTSTDMSGPSGAPGSFSRGLFGFTTIPLKVLNDSVIYFSPIFFSFFIFFFFPSRLDSAGFTALCLLQLNLNDMVFGKWKRAYLHIEWTDRITSCHWRTTLMPGNVRPLMMRSHGADFKTSRKPVKKNNNNQIGNSCMKVPSGSWQIFLSVPNHGGK